MSRLLRNYINASFGIEKYEIGDSVELETEQYHIYFWL